MTEIDEEDLIGQPMVEVPSRDATDERCMGKKALRENQEIVYEDDKKLFGGYCKAWPGKGTDHLGRGRCSDHDTPRLTGKDHPNYKHGAYSEHLQRDLTPEEREAYEDLVGALEDPEAALQAIRELAAEALLKYKRSGDHRFLREFRQLADTFNLAPNEEQFSIEAETSSELTLDDETRDLAREILAARRRSDE